MRFILAKANFSGEGNNIGTLNSWFVSYNKPNGITWSSIQSNVDKNATFTAMATLDSTNYEIQNVTVSMGNVSQSGAGSNGGISIEISENNIVIGIVSVTSNVNISVITKSKSSSPEIPEEPDTPANYTFTINPTPTSATVTLSATGYSTVSGAGSQSITVANGTVVSWRVSADGYTAQSGTWTANGSDGSKSVTLNAVVVDGNTTWYIDHRNNVASFTSSVNIAGRGWCHVPGTDVYNAYVGKPVNTIGFFTNLASQDVTISKVTEKGGEADMTEIATVTLTNPSGTTKGFCSVSFPTVTLADGECLAVYTQTDTSIQFYYQASGGPTTDANGVVDGNFYGRVPIVYGAGNAWTNYTSALCLGMSVGYNSEIA